MNRIYQGRVNNVQILKSGVAKPKTPDDWKDLSDDPKEARRLGEELLWNHHQLFQDAVNYYIVALTSLGSSPESKLTKLRGLLGNVWTGFDKKGQRRQGMRDSLQRAWQLAEPPTLEDAIKSFQEPLKKDGTSSNVAEKAGEFLLYTLGGEAAIQQGGRDFFPLFCDVDSTATFKLSAERRGRAEDEARLRKVLYEDLDQGQIEALAASISLGSVVNLQPGPVLDSGESLIARLRDARETFPEVIQTETFEQWITELRDGFQLPKRRGGNINVERVNACTLFLAFPNATTKQIFQSTFKAPSVSKGGKVNNRDDLAELITDESFIVCGDDPIKLARGTRGFVFRGFSALSVWRGETGKLAWKEFDIAAFKEALKVYNQFQQNVEKREAKLAALAGKLLIMDGERAMDAYADEPAGELSDRLQKLWLETKGKPPAPKNESGEEQAMSRFVGDPRVDRLRRIINDDLAEEYRLTEGRKTAYGLRRRTMKGWGEVKRKWQAIVKKGEAFSEQKRAQLKATLDEMRGGEKREQIGSHKLFEALTVDEAAWSIWREPDDKLQEQISKNGWATDPLEAFREYCEIREAMEEVSARPLNFTPADARFSRRLFSLKEGAGSFGKGKGQYKHDAKTLSVTVPIALRGPDGRYEAQACMISYSAPRLLRDRIRAEDGAYIKDWSQPMLRAIFCGLDKPKPQDLDEADVQLMPDSDSNGSRRILLNFPLTLDEAKVKSQIGKATVWEKQFVTWKKGAQLPFLRWPDELDGKAPHRWWEKLSRFRVLAADLGTRHAASIALVDFGQEGGRASRFVGSAGGKDWFGRFRSGAILRLPGEDAQVLRPKSPLDKDDLGKAFRTELHGERGRPADDAECAETFAMLAALNQTELLGGIAAVNELKGRFSFAEQNDKLLVAIRRAQGGIAGCISWHWKLSQPDSEEQKQSALEQLREQDRVPEWRLLADGGEENHVKLRDALHIHISTQRQQVQGHLLQLTDRIVPLLGRRWEWVKHPEKDDCHLLQQTARGSDIRKTKLRGQRGLSMARIEQLSELRRRWQSLNQSMRRQIGEKPLTAAQMRNDPIPDPCPDVLTKLENIREQRVNQTAHLILAQALGLKLRAPQMSAKSREITDTHGEYEVARPPVDMIVLEDLSRYLSDQGRAKSENTRLMKWCHRAIMMKVKMLAEPFGIPVLETPAAYSSRFCSLTGMAGFRAAEVAREDQHEFRWRVVLKEDLADLKRQIECIAGNKREAIERQYEIAKAVNEVFDVLEKIGQSGHPHRTLLAPQPGGPMFITALEAAHPAPSANRKQNDKISVLPMQADLNAAVNLAFRAVAHPGEAHIHHRLRTERKKGAKGQDDSFFAREARRFGKEKVALLLRDGDSLPKERNTNLFYDQHCVARFGRARLETDASTTHPYASGPGLWKAVNDRVDQWRRCLVINAARLRSWGIEPPPGWEPRGLHDLALDPDDDIPM
ncbi:MAG: type V CRISPR-associated protein Cas12b [Verrucomicrobia bacterium]|nr:type V CRISPR-associated protein Cas12b [Verrucomicrobiota bacterium]